MGTHRDIRSRIPRSNPRPGPAATAAAPGRKAGTRNVVSGPWKSAPRAPSVTATALSTVASKSLARPRRAADLAEVKRGA